MSTTNGHAEETAFSNSLTTTLSGSYAFGTSAVSQDELKAKRSLRLFGYPLHNTLAPLIHNKIFSLRGIPWHYSTLESQDPNDLLKELDAEECVGEAVTMPYKLVFTKHVDHLSESAAAIGAINTIFFRRTADGKRIRVGGNTDVLGVRDSFLHNSKPEDVQKAATRPGLIVGCGGAARSSVYALWRCFGVKKFLLANRLKSEADDLAMQFQKIPGWDATFTFLASGEEAKAAETPHFVVGNIPDYPPSKPEEYAVQDVLHELLTSPQRDRGVVLEMCYHPKVRTSLYETCEKAGWNVIPGTEASMWQAFAQQVLWTENAEIKEEWIGEIRAEILKAIEGQRKG